MAVDYANFILDFPEFSDVTQYPISGFAYWANLAGMLISQDRFGSGSVTPSSPPTTIYDVAIELFVAHNLVLEKQANDSARNGAAPGISQGPVSAKSIDGLSLSYNTAAGIDPNAGHWNLTTFGTRLWSLLKDFGAGPVQITGSAPPYGPGYGVPWYGPVAGQGGLY